ncbi:MAG TPA: hypothetical protein VN420_02520 [Candidatus Fimivivens sp.]|nr:hypothetical protein [Candidatus Fimivivens sp.]
MSSYALGKRTPRDLTVMSHDEVRKLAKGGKSYRIADEILRRFPALKAGINHYDERKEFGKRIAEAGGVKYASQSKDFFGLTEGELLREVKLMADQGKMSRHDAIEIGKQVMSVSKSVGSFKRQQIRELYKIGHDHAPTHAKESIPTAQTVADLKKRAGYGRKSNPQADTSAALRLSHQGDLSHASRTVSPLNGSGSRPTGGSHPSAPIPRRFSLPPRSQG